MKIKVYNSDNSVCVKDVPNIYYIRYKNDLNWVVLDNKSSLKEE